VDPARHTILVVDDEFMIVETLAEILEWKGFRVLTASNGREALALLEREVPSVVLLDFMMPVMDGAEVLAEMRKRPALANLPVIVMTAATRTPAGMPAQWNALLAKPFGLPALERALADVLDEKAR